MFGIGLSDAYGWGDFMVVSKNGAKGRQDGGGDAYVRAAQKFDSYTLHVMLNCPERWREYLVTPITNDTRRIADDAVMANSRYVRMDRQSTLEDVIAAYMAGKTRKPLACWMTTMPLFRRGMTADTIAFSVRCIKRELYRAGNRRLYVGAFCPAVAAS